MPKFRKSSDKAVEQKPNKYDGFKLVKTEHPYKHQKGSGRAEAFTYAKDGMLIKAWAKICATHGHETKFVVGSLLKLSGTSAPGWTISEKDDKGRTLADVKKVRDVDPAKKAERTARARAASDAKAAKAAAKKTSKKAA